MVEPRRHGEGEREGDGSEPRRAGRTFELPKPEPGSTKRQKEFCSAEQHESAGQGEREHEKREGREGLGLAVGCKRHPTSVPAIPEWKGALFPGHSDSFGPRCELRGEV